MSKFIGQRVVSIFTWAWRCYVASVLWAWFAEPIGAPHLAAVRAMGIGLVVNLAVKRISYADAEAEQRLKDKVGKGMFYTAEVALSLLGPLVVLGFGWLYRCFL